MDNIISIQRIQSKLTKLTTNNTELVLDGFFVGAIYNSLQNKSVNDIDKIIAALENINILRKENIITIQQKQAAYSHIIDKIGTKNYEALIQEEVEKIFGEPQIQRNDSEEQKSMKYIQELQIQEKMEKEKMMQMQKEQQVMNEQCIKKIQEEEQKIVEENREKRLADDNKDNNCNICLLPMLEGDFWPLDCGHVYHINCLKEYYQNLIQEKKFPIKCPFEGCNEEAVFEDLKKVLSQEYIEKFFDYTFNSYVDQNQDNMSWCPTANCKYVFVFDNNNYDFTCEVCQKRYCLKCKVEYHVGQTCDEYQISKKFDKNDKLFLDFVKGQKYKQCPKCKMWVLKESGCNYMKCKCGQSFCWNCGGIYGKCQCGQIVPGHDPKYEQEYVQPVNQVPYIKPFVNKIYNHNQYKFFGAKNKNKIKNKKR